VRPVETGIGLAPHSAAKEASLVRRSMFWPAVTTSVAAWPVETASSEVVRRAAWATSLGYRVGKVTPRGIEFYEAWHPELESFKEGNYVCG
jgi:hypothetical protein